MNLHQFSVVSCRPNLKHWNATSHSIQIVVMSLQALDLYMPYVWEYARLNVQHNVLSKRKLNRLAVGGLVDGWDDPRLLTLAGLRRRGVTPKVRTLAHSSCNGKQHIKNICHNLTHIASWLATRFETCTVTENLYYKVTMREWSENTCPQAGQLWLQGKGRSKFVSKLLV